MKTIALGLMVMTASAVVHAQKLPVLKSELNLTGKVSSELSVSVEVYAESTNRTRPELTLDGWKQVPLISDKTEDLQVSSTNTFAKKLVSNWTTGLGTNYQAKLYRVHVKAADYSEDSFEIYIDKNCGTTPGFEAGNTLVVTKKNEYGSKYLSSKLVNNVNDAEGERAICLSPRDNETINETLNIVLK